MVTFNSLENTILGHLAANVKYYEQFHAGDMLKDAGRYFKCRGYCDNVLNVIIFATTRTLKLKLTVYQREPKGNIQILEQTTHATGKEVHLKFTWDSHNLAHNHYEAILFFDKSGVMHREDEVVMESPSSSTLGPISQDDADEVIDLTDDSDMTAIQQPVLVQYNTSNNELQLPTHFFVNIATEWVEYLPQDIDGLKIYKIKCLPRVRVKKNRI